MTHNSTALTDLAGTGAAPGAPYLDFGARLYSPGTASWLSVDPMAEKYYGIGSLTYCAANPVNLVDPEGLIWDNPTDASYLASQAYFRLLGLTAERDADMALLEQSFDVELTERINRIAELDMQISYLDQALSDIQLLANDLEHIYVLDPVLKINHNVRLGAGNKIYIETSSDALSLHEISHVRQMLDAGGLRFNTEGRLLNAGKTIPAQIRNEVEAYKIQYSFDPSSFPGVLYGAKGIEGVNYYSVSNMVINGEPAYLFLK